MSVHYKFKSALEYDTVTFDGLHISVRDLKNSIMQQKRIGKNTDFDLQVTNAQTKEIYDNDETLIPKNTSLLIARIPSVQVKPKTWEGYGGNSSPVPKTDDGGPASKAVDLSSLDASEEDKIKAMMSQSTQDYDPSNYLKIRGANQVGPVPPTYRCYKCHQGGHWIRDCPLSQGSEPMEIKKSTGIPRSFMVPVEGPQVPGAMMTPNGSFAVPVLDHQAYTEKPQPAPPEEKKPEIPEDLLCSLCSDLLTDAVMIPCCGDSYCDECIRSCLLESEDHECPACHERDISPGTLIPNRYLRNSVANFKSTTGYVKRLVSKLPQTPIKAHPDIIPEPTFNVTGLKEATPPPVSKVNAEEKTVIREADSTETPKTTVEPKKEESAEDADLKETEKSAAVIEGPPGVSPHRDKSPKAQRITNVTVSRHHRPHPKMNSNERSPRRPHHVKRSPTYIQDAMSRVEDRPGTPTVDEPGVGGTTTICSNTVYHSAPPLYSAVPPSNMNPIMAMQAPNMQRPPPIMAGAYPGPIPPTYPPPGPGPLPNYRLPPPGAPPYMPGGYTAPPRPVFDCTRPPLQGHASYPVYPPGPRPSRNRDYPRDVSRRGRTPTRIIDDPLEAFNRMLREKDERVRRAKQRKARSYSRSSSRSFSPSPRRLRSRSPRRRSRSRSRSFSLSRSRSRSFSPSPRTSPPRHFSPKRSPHRGPHRYRSPVRSPPRYRFKDTAISERERGRDRDLDRERDRDKEFRDRDTNYNRDRERDFRERDHRDYGYGGYDRDRQRGRQQWNQSLQRKDYVPPDNYYHAQEMAAQPPPFVQSNRYPPRDVYPPHHIPPLQHPPVPHAPAQHLPPPIRRYDDVAPPGTEQPPIPGLENTPSPTHSIKDKESERRDHRDEANVERKHDARSPDRNRYASPRRPSKDREHRSPEKHKHRRRDDSFDIEKREFERVHERKRDVSDDERTKKNKDKKRKKEKREKKEEERKKRKEKKEKREHDKQRRAAEEKEKSERKSKSSDRKEEVEGQSHENNDSERPKHSEKIEKRRVSEDASDDKDFVDEIRERNKKAQAESKRESNTSERDYPPDTDRFDVSPKTEDNHDLYGDLLSEDIDNSVIENYGKLKEESLKDEETSEGVDKTSQNDDGRDEGELSYDDDSEKDILELHTNEADLKTDMDIKNEMLAHLPERSKWEVEDELFPPGSSGYGRGDGKLDRLDKSGKVTNEVLKRAENAIFAKAINAIRPIEIKKISLDRAKLYSGERDRDKKSDDLREGARNYHVIITETGGFDDDVVPVEPVEVTKPRLSVKERLGCKVDDLDRIVKVEKPYDRNRSRSLSPLSRRAGELNRNLGQGERRIEIDDRKRYDSRGDKGRDRHHRSFRGDRETRPSIRRDIKRDSYRERDYRKIDRRVDRREPIRARSRGRVREKSRDLDEKRNRDRKKSSRSRSPSDKDKRKRRDRKEKKKEKVNKRHRKDEEEKETVKGSKNEDEKVTKAKSTTDKRKPTLDESNFEPDYDLESESEKDDGTKKEEKVKQKRTSSPPAEEEVSKKKTKVEESSSSESSDSSSDEERRKKKHRKHKKKRSRKDSSSSSESESESESSDEDKDKKKRKHKKKLKKKKKAKHKN
ncbi:E3 ubiquitin-protein ligase RBBP6 isoform X3 [Photinus pyralis]|uniref:E3 ubiquitin-protein ligase RBBP6 isoform X3 n=1 Tax=Photinus pyralis TaxID=7054 RepID=UPI00126772B8|nr:E3 ubiquitin-protein ligase RBBP6 isoform X3 [Photinus pyralis]